MYTIAENKHIKDKIIFCYKTVRLLQSSITISQMPRKKRCPIEKVWCKECKFMIAKSYLERHEKNKSHLQFVETKKWNDFFANN